MKDIHLVDASKADSAPMCLSTSLIVVVCAVVVGAVLSIAVWWTADHGAPYAKPYVDSAALAAPPRSIEPAVAPEQNGGLQSAARSPESRSTGPEAPQPAVDLLAAMKHAQATAGSRTLPPPPGRSSWQGMSLKDAAMAFDEVVKAGSYSSSASPFRHGEANNQTH